MRRAVLAALLAAALLPGEAGAFEAPAAWGNYAHTPRPGSAVRLVVVHVTEGSFGGTIAWFRNPRARVSANYVVGRDGRVAHMVPNSRVAWHAGNSSVNYRSIGVENEGYTDVDGTFTDAEYRASARLVASLLRAYRLPADRGHVIGHYQVPDPNHRGQYGGFAHHHDPGLYWDWTRYMTYIRDYRAGRTPPPRPLDVTIPGLGLGQTVTGVVSWTAVPAGEPVDHVDFVVDGVVRATVTEAPYTYDWDTAFDANGRHVLTARAVGLDGRSASATVVVDSSTATPAPPVVTLPSLVPGAAVTGVLDVEPQLSGGPFARVELWIDGTVAATSTEAPWTFAWDSASVSPGPHTLAVRAVGARGKTAAAVVQITTGP